ncbi:hypothetical protein [Streptomyces naganishii]|uniref:Uncharacterized protein n=1 Tax=Streptomyces naganishii JCM 4654 TaxID=1306179 RepID=A0A919D0B8_9ACTN|nr:hypothetical protein [Streptomyces naganishii]GHD96117.1 hypothetical protein GCM10010508_63600 [Streptomyces naganishii JCM 4654]
MVHTLCGRCCGRSRTRPRSGRWCVGYGDTGQGKTVALQYALSQLPHPARVRRVNVWVLTWELVPRLRPVEVAAVMAAFHPLWEGVGEDDVVWVDEHVGHGNVRTWVKLTSHLTAEIYGKSRAAADRRLLDLACARLMGPL